jgi:hypothetical protein
MPVVAHVAITLNLPFGAVDYSLLDETIGRALREAHVPVIDVEVEGLAEADAPVDPAAVGLEPLSPFASAHRQIPLGPPGPFGTRI